MALATFAPDTEVRRGNWARTVGLQTAPRSSNARRDRNCRHRRPKRGTVTRSAFERLVVDAEAERRGVLFERAEQMGVAVTANRLAGRIERDGLDARKRLGLRDVEDGCELEPDQLLLHFVPFGLLGIAAAVADRAQDTNGLLALAHTASEFQPAAE